MSGAFQTPWFTGHCLIAVCAPMGRHRADALDHLTVIQLHLIKGAIMQTVQATQRVSFVLDSKLAGT